MMSEDAHTPPPAAVRRGPASRWKVIFVTLLVLGVLGTVTWVLLGSRLLVVRHVDVAGTKLLGRGQVAAAGRIPLGTPMVRVDTAAVRRRVETLQQVESVHVERDWPGTVRIVVRERVPVVTAASGGRYVEIDKYGVTVLTVPARPKGLPQLLVARPDAADPTTAAALASWRGLPASFTQRITEVRASSPESVTFRLTDGMTVVWGAPERAAEKLRLIAALTKSATGRASHSIDVSSPEVVTMQ
jgi:cell division protein FtsQ